MKSLILNSVIIISAALLITSPICLMLSHDLARFIQIIISIVGAVVIVLFDNAFKIVSALDKITNMRRGLICALLFIAAIAVNAVMVVIRS